MYTTTEQQTSPFHTQEARPWISYMDSPLPVQRQHRVYP